MHKWSTSCTGGRSKINNLLVSFINLNVITCNMKKKKNRKKKWQNDKLYPYLWRFATSVYDSTFGKVHHTMIQFYYAVKWAKKSSVCTVLHSLHFNMTDFHEASGPLHDNGTKSSQVKKKLEQQNNDKNGEISNVLNFQGSIMTSWHPH